MAAFRLGADIASENVDGQVVPVTITNARYAPMAGFALLIAGPFVLSFPFLQVWHHAGWQSKSLGQWLLPVLATSLAMGSMGFVPLRFRTSTKALMALFYVPIITVALLVWSYAWYPLCDF